VKPERRYWGNYPAGVAGVIRAEIPGHVLSALFFFALPLGGAACSFAAESWAGVPFGVALTLVVFLYVASLVNTVRRRFGLRIVVQLDRRLEDRPATYWSGESIARYLRPIDRATGEPALSSFIHQSGANDSGSAWFEPAEGKEAVARLLGCIDDVSVGTDERQKIREDAETILRALDFAVEAGTRFRFVVVAVMGMNGMLWERLASEGF